MSCPSCGGRLVEDYELLTRSTELVCINCGHSRAPASQEPYRKNQWIGATGRSRLQVECPSEKLYPRRRVTR